MRTLFISVVMVLCPLAAARADLPFSPVPTIADHVATYVVKRGWEPNTDDSKTVTHHAGWSRIDLVQNGAPSTSYVGYAQPTSITVTRNTAGKYLHLSMSRGAEQHKTPGLDYNAVKTGERQTFLGEQCDVWRLRRGRDVDLVQLACFTDDGIELWQRYEGRYSGTFSSEATSIRRRPVGPTEVHPPGDLLDLKAWVDLPEQLDPRPTAAGVPGDVVVVLELPGSIDPRYQVTKTMRRHHPWVATDTLRGTGARSLTVDNVVSRLHIRVQSDAAGVRELMMGKAPIFPFYADGRPDTPPREDIVLRERCTWLDMMPDVMDAGLLQCRTDDGVVLKETTIMRGSHKTLEATRLGRRAVALTKVLPPAYLLERSTWGIPD